MILMRDDRVASRPRPMWLFCLLCSLCGWLCLCRKTMGERDSRISVSMFMEDPVYDAMRTDESLIQDPPGIERSHQVASGWQALKRKTMLPMQYETWRKMMPYRKQRHWNVSLMRSSITAADTLMEGMAQLQMWMAK